MAVKPGQQMTTGKSTFATRPPVALQQSQNTNLLSNKFNGLTELENHMGNYMDLDKINSTSPLSDGLRPLLNLNTTKQIPTPQ